MLIANVPLQLSNVSLTGTCKGKSRAPSLNLNTPCNETTISI